MVIEMANLLAKLSLWVKDYQTNEEAETTFAGEIVSIDQNLKTNIYRFFNEESGSLLVSIDYSNEKILIQERSANVKMHLELLDAKMANCNYQFDENNSLYLLTKAYKIEIDDNNFLLEYDLFNPNDVINPLTRNIVKIECEVRKPC